MRTYADPTRCPDCAAPLRPGASQCAQCGLVLAGQLGQQLFATLTEADRLLGLMRAARTPSAVQSSSAVRESVLVGGGSTVPPAPIAGVAPPAPSASIPAPRAERHRALPVPRASSVPKILLGLGALCLLVAAAVFLAVTWSRLGVGGRTATLLVFTATTGAITWWGARSGLRAVVESLGLVTLGLVALDVLGARNAGWLGQPDDDLFVTVLGIGLAAVALLAAYALTRTPAGGFTTAELVAVGGTWAAWLSVGQLVEDAATGALLSLGLVVVVAVPVRLLLDPGTPRGPETPRRAGRFQVAWAGLGALAAFGWLRLFGTGLDGVFSDTQSVSRLWGDLAIWPLPVAAALAAALVVGALQVFPRWGETLRPLVLNAAVLAGALALVAPAFDETTTVLTATLVAVTLAAAAYVGLAAPLWAAGGLLTLGLAALFPLGQAFVLATTALDRLLQTVEDPWDAPVGLLLPAAAANGDPAGWILPLALVAVMAAAWALARLAIPQVRAGATTPWLVTTGLVVAAGATGALALTSAPVLLIVALVLLLGAGAVAAVLYDDSLPAAMMAVPALTLAGIVSAYSAPVATVTLLLATGLALAVHLRSRDVVIATGAGVLGAPLLAAAGWAAWEWVGDPVTTTPTTTLAALLAVVTLALATLALSYAPQPVPGSRSGWEIGAALVATGVGVVGVDAAAFDSEAFWASIYLAVAGATVIALALLHPARRRLAWAGGALLVLASWGQLIDLGVEEPEPYSLPTALVLLVVGAYRLRAEPSLGTWPALGPGLALALLPSLWWVVAIEPESWRAVLLGAASLGAVALGAWRRWAAPLLLGAAVAATVVIREAAPWLGDNVPRWALIGAAGAALIVVGLTWEKRLAEARGAVDKIRALR